MPKGVEHLNSIVRTQPFHGRVRTAVMPKGVEHASARSWSCVSWSGVRTAVMPKGVEHIDLMDSRIEVAESSENRCDAERR